MAGSGFDHGAVKVINLRHGVDQVNETKVLRRFYSERELRSMTWRQQYSTCIVEMEALVQHLHSSLFRSSPDLSISSYLRDDLLTHSLSRLHLFKSYRLRNRQHTGGLQQEGNEDDREVDSIVGAPLQEAELSEYAYIFKFALQKEIRCFSLLV